MAVQFRELVGEGEVILESLFLLFSHQHSCQAFLIVTTCLNHFYCFISYHVILCLELYLFTCLGLQGDPTSPS